MFSNSQAPRRCNARAAFAPLVALALALAAATAAQAQKPSEEIPEINGIFHFLNPSDTLLIHEEDGRLKGQINAYQGEEESDVILSYLITIGRREKNHLEFKTSKVHERYFRFSGTAVRGSGRKDSDPDYLELVGDLEIIQVRGATGKETTETRHVVLKSLGASEIEE